MKTKQEILDDFNENERKAKETKDKKERFYSEEMNPFKKEYIKYLTEILGNAPESIMLEGLSMRKDGQNIQIKSFDNWYNDLP